MFSTTEAFRTAARAGAIGGVTLGSLALIQLLLALAGLNADAQQNLGYAVLIAYFTVFFVVGLLVRRRTDSVAAAMRAGLVSGVYAGTVAALGAAALAIFAPNVDLAAIERDRLFYGKHGAGEARNLPQQR